MTIKIKLLIGALFILVLVFLAGVQYVLFLNKAHSTFENYYAFRGCVQLVSKTDSYGICRLASGEIIKMVNYQGKWYLDGDLPCGFLCF